MTPWLILLIIVIVIFIVWWALQRNAKMYKPEFKVHGHEEEQHTHPTTTTEAPQVELPATPETVRATEAVFAAAQPDDLTIIEGIGPKVNQVLQASGIQTFAQLAETSEESLKAMLASAGLQHLDPGTWAEQAALVSEGKMDEFEALTSRLKGGREAS